jgi:transposase
LTEKGIECHVIHPTDIPYTYLEKKRKNDFRDSRKIARELSNGSLIPITVPDQQRQSDRDLVRLHSRLIFDRTRIKNRIKSYLVFWGIFIPKEFEGKNWPIRFVHWLKQLNFPEPSAKQTLDFYLDSLQNLNQQIKLVNQQIDPLCLKQPYVRLIPKLRTIPSIGKLSAMIILTEVGPINRFPSIKHLCSYFGITPNTYSSGENNYVGRMTKHGNNHLKRILIECAWQAMRKDPALYLYYKRRVGISDKNKTIVKVARKLLNRIRFVLKNEENYQKGIVAST